MIKALYPIVDIPLSLPINLQSKCEFIRSTGIFEVDVKCSMRDLISDVISCRAAILVK